MSVRPRVPGRIEVRVRRLTRAAAVALAGLAGLAGPGRAAPVPATAGKPAAVPAKAPVAVAPKAAAPLPAAATAKPAAKSPAAHAPRRPRSHRPRPAPARPYVPPPAYPSSAEIAQAGDDVRRLLHEYEGLLDQVELTQWKADSGYISAMKHNLDASRGLMSSVRTWIDSIPGSGANRGVILLHIFSGAELAGGASSLGDEVARRQGNPLLAKEFLSLAGDGSRVSIGVYRLLERQSAEEYELASLQARLRER